mmetsp:Transcript_15597/g.33052  ORF Transcript_15597/g.33052 Transcript_15597/m.33052 type:complete len:272 (-) Transcript_15597:319-1134(-)
MPNFCIAAFVSMKSTQNSGIASKDWFKGIYCRAHFRRPHRKSKHHYVRLHMRISRHFSNNDPDAHKKPHFARFQDEAAISSVIILTAFFGVIAYNFASFGDQSSAKGRKSLYLSLEAQAVMTLFLAVIVVDHIFTRNQENADATDYLQESRVRAISFVTNLIGFNFVLLPFIAGGLYYLISPSGLFLLAIPLSSLIICSLVGLYHPSVAHFTVFTTLLILCVNMIFWMMSTLYGVYGSIVRMHISIIQLFILSVLIAQHIYINEARVKNIQ